MYCAEHIAVIQFIFNIYFIEWISVHERPSFDFRLNLTIAWDLRLSTTPATRSLLHLSSRQTNNLICPWYLLCSQFPHFTQPSDRKTNKNARHYCWMLLPWLSQIIQQILIVFFLRLFKHTAQIKVPMYWRFVLILLVNLMLGCMITALFSFRLHSLQQPLLECLQQSLRSAALYSVGCISRLTSMHWWQWLQCTSVIFTGMPTHCMTLHVLIINF